MQPSLPKDALYFGSSVVALDVVDGATKRHVEGALWGDLAGPPTLLIPRDNVDGPRSRLESQQHGDFKIVVPAVPASDIAGELPDDNGELPTLLSQPLIKKGAGKLFGIQSGRRSAVVTNGREWFRLKGCGSYGQGFPLEHVFPATRKFERQDMMMVTGCMMHDAALRELHMTEVVNQLLTDNGLIGGNVPLGYWEYKVPHNPPITANLTPDLPKRCALFRTHGDKRFSTHLITGLERLLPLMCPGVGASHLLDLFPENRLDDSAPGGVLRTHQFIFDQERERKGSSSSPPCDDGLVNLCTVLLPEILPDGEREEVSTSNSKAWTSATESLATVMSRGAGQAGSDFIAHVVWRLGREAGKIRRIMNENGIMWGYFFDHDPNHAHNNSDPSNLVLLPKGCNGDQLLAPVDFDMCYTRSSFMIGAVESPDFPKWPTEESIGGADVDKFNLWLEQETYLMEMAIGGNVDGADTLDDTANLLMTCVRDTCLLGFRSALRGDEDLYPLDGEYADHAYDIINMALCLSDNEDQVTRLQFDDTKLFNHGVNRVGQVMSDSKAIPQVIFAIVRIKGKQMPLGSP